tara:strand:- start:2645 stop:3781 length:1137 start_codon:yes stop_codon:yes gene_type:complete
MELLLKGFEVELFTGISTGEHVGVAASATIDLPDFVKEPDQRNLEFITSPYKQYSKLSNALLTPRINLRKWLNTKNLTILPGSTLSLGDSTKFERSDGSNSYHELIEKTYGTTVVTTSVHINLGIEDLSNLFAALRLVRCESALFLALSANSPFLDAAPTGMHSQRWMQFPRTPENIPLFTNHDHYVKWIEEQLSSGVMWNERHLWTSVRPNGPNRPYELNRLELRICDLITNCDLLLSVTALLELRILSLMNDIDNLDPLKVSKLNINDLACLSNMNDLEAAKFSLNATLSHWIDGREIQCRDWILELLESVAPLASDMGLTHILEPISTVLSDGNQAMQWLKGYSNGSSINELIQASIHDLHTEEIVFLKNQASEG